MLLTLPLGANLRGRGINTPGLCPHCNEDETALYLFFLCPFAIQVWERAPYAIQPNFSDAETLHDAFLLMSTMVSLPPTGFNMPHLLASMEHLDCPELVNLWKQTDPGDYRGFQDMLFWSWMATGTVADLHTTATRSLRVRNPTSPNGRDALQLGCCVVFGDPPSGSRLVLHGPANHCHPGTIPRNGTHLIPPQ